MSTRNAWVLLYKGKVLITQDEQINLINLGQQCN